jgi:hypothetical protein
MTQHLGATDMDNLPKKALPDKGQCDGPNTEVGYGRPPKDTRFKPGESGNPGGRPKGSKNLATLVRKHLQSMLTVRENGRERRMSKLDVGITKMVNRFAEQGELRLFSELKKLFDRPEAQTIEIRLPVDVTRLTLEDLANVIDEQMERLMYRTMMQRRLSLGDAAGETDAYEPQLPHTIN